MPVTAPVCAVSANETIQQPKPVQYPSIPVATDLPSAIAAINAMRQVVQKLSGGFTTSSSGKKNTPAPPQTTFTEISRATKTVRITNPNDPTQFIDVERISSLTLKDSQTGETWGWNL